MRRRLEQDTRFRGDFGGEGGLGGWLGMHVWFLLRLAPPQPGHLSPAWEWTVVSIYLAAAESTNLINPPLLVAAGRGVGAAGTGRGRIPTNWGCREERTAGRSRPLPTLVPYQGNDGDK